MAWVVRLVKPPTINDFRSDYFPRRFHYKADAEVLKAEVEHKGGEAVVEKPCLCRKPKHHRDCAYCGCGWGDGSICGVCKEQGIDGHVIRGTSRVVCAQHKAKVNG